MNIENQLFNSSLTGHTLNSIYDLFLFLRKQALFPSK